MYFIVCFSLMLLVVHSANNLYGNVLERGYPAKRLEMGSVVGGDRAVVEYVLIKIKSGDANILKTISYKTLQSVLDYSYSRSNYKDLYERRGKVVNSLLKGLFNNDPRVLLLCIELLNLMKPDRLMEPEVSLIYERFSKRTYYHLANKNFVSSSLVARGEVVSDSIGGDKSACNDCYEYIDIFRAVGIKSISSEVLKLYKYVKRDKYVHEMLKKDPQFLSKIKKGDFAILHEKIDNEPDEIIPFRSFKTTDFISKQNIRVIVNGLNNKNLLVRKECALFLVNYYRYNAFRLNLYYRNIILKAIKDAYRNNIIPKKSLTKSLTNGSY